MNPSQRSLLSPEESFKSGSEESVESEESAESIGSGIQIFLGIAV